MARDLRTAAMPASKMLFFDCETTGLPRSRHFSIDNVDDWPRLVQIAWARYDSGGDPEVAECHIVRPEGFRIPVDATRIHGITDERARREGRGLADVLDEFLEEAERPGTTLVAHNFDYDRGVVGGELVRLRRSLRFLELPSICTMKGTTELCGLPRPGGFGYKWPTLEELHRYVFGFSYEGVHDAANDIDACARAFFRLREAGHFRISGG
jgi:DNA polymerase III epsilon subunit-like protein